MMRSFLYLIGIMLNASVVCAQEQSSIIAAYQESYILEDSGKYIKAIQPLMVYYEKDSYELNIRIGWLYYNAGNYPSSRRYYMVATKLLPYSIEAKLGLALPLSGLGNWDQVIDLYQEVLDIDPNNSLVNYRLGSIYYYRQEYDLAYNFLERVVNQYPMDYDSVILFAWTNLKLSKLREAKILFKKALLLHPDAESPQEGLKLIQ